MEIKIHTKRVARRASSTGKMGW